MSDVVGKKTVRVVAAVVEREGRYLITQRREHAVLSLLWEFPGGKVEPGESLADGLRRELKEELGAEVEIGEEVFTVTHDYADRSVELHFLSCTFLNAPMARLGQEMRWVPRDQLQSLKFPPADDDWIRVLVGR